MIVWLLFLAEKRKKVGIGKTSDFDTQRGSVEAFAKGYGLVGFDARSGYRRLTRVEFTSPVGKDKLFRGDKPGILRLTRIGIGVLQYLSTNPAWRGEILLELGADIPDVKEWFPVPIKPDAPIQMMTTSPRPKAEPYTIQVTATFTCDRCNNLVQHQYDLLWRTEEWMEVAVICGECGTMWQHWKGYPYQAPQPANP